MSVGMIGSSAMYCDPEARMTQEGNYLAALQSAASFAITDEELRIENADGEVVLVFSVLDPTPLIGTTWKLSGYHDGKSAFVSVLSGTEITAVFGEDGSVAGSASCNNYRGSHEVDGSALTFGPLATTRMACAEPEGIMDQESAYLAALGSATAYEIKGDRLEMANAEGIRIAAFTAADVPEIVGVVWKWEKFLESNDDTIIVDDPEKYTLEFMPDGTFSIRADCNRASGTYTLDGSSLSIEITVSTLAECEPDSLYDEYIKYLNAAVSYVTVDGELAISLIYDTGIMMFTEGSDEAGEPAREITLEGALWRLESYLSDQGELVSVLPDTEIAAEFEGGQVTGSAGCNSYFASYEVDGNSLSVGMIGASAMYCDPEARMTQEGNYLTALQSASSFAIADEELTIENADGEVVLTFSVLDPTPLAGTTWKLKGYHDGKSGFVSVLAGTEITAVFGEDGSVAGSAGCNNFRGSYEIDGSAMTFGPLITTRMACADPEGIMDQESAYLTALGSANAYEITGNKLEITDPEGTRVAAFTAADVPEIVGVVWKWERSLASNDDILIVDDPERYTLEFMPDGSFSIRADCNRASGTYTLDGSSLSIEVTVSTLAECEPGSLYDEYIKYLNATVSYVTVDGELAISLIYDTGIMMFAKGS